MRKSKFYTALKMCMIALFLINLIIAMVTIAHDTDNVKMSGSYFLLAVGFLSIFLALEGGTKIVDREWFLYSPDEPFTWDEKIFYPINFVFSAIMWIIANAISFASIISVFAGGPLLISYVAFGISIETLAYGSIFLSVLLGIVWLANNYNIRRKMF